MVVAGAGILIGGLAAADGGYFAGSWSWSALALVWALAMIFALGRPVGPGKRELFFGMAAIAVPAFAFLSSVWSQASNALLDGQRDLVYALVVVTALVAVRRAALWQLLAGVQLAIVTISAYSLAQRLFPERLGRFDPTAVYRLTGPIGYWNGLGVCAAMGLLIGLGLALRSDHLGSRALSAGSLVVLAPTLYFTFSRGGSIALGVGLLFVVALDPRRLQFIAGSLLLAPAPVLCVYVASRSNALTRQNARLATATHDGHRLALAVGLLALASALVAAALGLLERRWAPRRDFRLAFAGTVALIAVLAVVLVFVQYGGPTTLVHKAYDAFRAPPAHVNGDLNKRLFSFSGNGRADLWHSAWRDYVHHPAVGSGARSYERWWNQHRSTGLDVRDAHNLYLETLAELGPLGLLLVLTIVVLPLAAAVRARGHPLVPAVAGAFFAWAIHAAVDWDWELAAVTSAALLCGCALLIAARREERTWEPSTHTRVALVSGLVILGGFAIVALVGNTAVSRADSAAAAGKWQRSADEARKATHWMGWSAEPSRLLGEAEIALRRPADARVALRKSLEKDDGNWVTWFDLAQASKGSERKSALAEARRLNPLDPDLRSFSR